MATFQDLHTKKPARASPNRLLVETSEEGAIST